ncbi:MAG: C4-dicarboxylate ABC transporter [Rhodobacteraceae bacterium]|nr:C4-dicarboxylate ABC transporter [Paracoccaceae bacterium]
MSDNQHSQIEHMPITFFAIVMGVMGLALAAHAGGFETIAIWVRWAGIVGFGAIALAYLAKAVRYPAAVVGEWRHPVRIAFFPAISISLLLIAAALRSSDPEAARIVWWIGMLGQGVLTLSVISSWIGHRSFQVGHLTPAWFIPAVGNVIVPVAGVGLGHPEISWLFFSAGMIFWLVLLTLVFNRLVFHDPIPARLFPTLVILIAPPAVGFVAWLEIAGGVDHFGHFLLSTAYVFALLVIGQMPKILRLPFSMAFWALSFPVAALSIGSFRYATLTGSAAHHRIGLLALAILAVIVGGLSVRTVLGMIRGEICRPE